MTKSRRNRKSNLLNSISPESLGKGLESVGSTAKNLAAEATPIVERGVSTVYGTLASGVNLGTNVARGIVSSKKRSHHRKRGGSKRRTHRRKSHRRRR